MMSRKIKKFLKIANKQQFFKIIQPVTGGDTKRLRSYMAHYRERADRWNFGQGTIDNM